MTLRSESATTWTGEAKSEDGERTVPVAHDVALVALPNRTVSGECREELDKREAASLERTTESVAPVSAR